MKKATIVMLIAVTLILSTLPSMCAQAEEPRHGGTLVAVIPGDIPTLNPALTTSENCYIPAHDMFLPMLVYDLNWTPQPRLAESWAISSDGLTYTFNLAHNVTFHDGIPLTSADVKFSIEEVIIPYNPIGSTVFGKVIDRIETPDNYTVVFKLKYPSGFFLLTMNPYYLTILPKHLYEGTDILNNPYNLAPVGAGPFKFKEFVSGDHLTLVKNENYFRQDKPYLDKIVWRSVPSEASAVMMLEAGEVDYFPRFIESVDVPRLISNTKLVMFTEEAKALGEGPLVIFNCREDHKTGDKRVRQALTYAINKSEILEKIGMGYGIATYGANPFVPGVDWCYDTNLNPRYEYNVTKANEILDEAGYPRGSDGVRFHLKGVGAMWSFAYYKTVELVSAQLAKVGIVTDYVQMERPEFNEKVFKGYDYDYTCLRYTSGPDPSLQMERYLTTDMITGSSFRNLACFSNGTVDVLFGLADLEADPVIRKQYFFKIQEVLNAEAPYVLTYQDVKFSAWSKDLRGFPKGFFSSAEPDDEIWWSTTPEYIFPVIPTVTVVIIASITAIAVTVIVLKKKRKKIP